MNHLISVIIPCYNNSVSICNTLDSLVQQTKTVYEVLIIDDFSNDFDELQKVVLNYKEKLPIKLLRNEENKKGAYTRNRGIKEAKGDIIAFLDADDLWLSHKVSTIIEKVNLFGKDNLFFSKVKIENNGEIVGSRPSHFNPNVHISEYLFLEDGFIQTSSIFCSTKIAREILFQEHYKRHQDYDFVLRAAYNNVEFQFIEDELAIYSSDISVNLSKGEASKYSIFWLNDMKTYFSKSGFKGFQFFNITARLLAEKKYLKAIINVITVFFSLNIKDYKRIFPKFKRTIKGVLLS